MKVCNFCHTEQPISNFGYHVGRGKRYLRNKCRGCRRIEDRARFDKKVAEDGGFPCPQCGSLRKRPGPQVCRRCYLKNSDAKKAAIAQQKEEKRKERYKEVKIPKKTMKRPMLSLEKMAKDSRERAVSRMKPGTLYMVSREGSTLVMSDTCFRCTKPSFWGTHYTCSTGRPRTISVMMPVKIAGTSDAA